MASDGAGANGLYTENLLREMRVPEAKIEDVFKRVRLAVRRGSNGAQIPWESTSLEDDFWFIPPKELKKLSDEEAEREFEKEAALWERAETAREPAALEDYLRRYPSGHFSELAQVHLDELLAAQGEKKAEVVASAEQPVQQGLRRADTDYKVGDTYTYALADQISRVVQRTDTLTVTRVTRAQVLFDNGLITDRLGNLVRCRGARNISGNQSIRPSSSSAGSGSRASPASTADAAQFDRRAHACASRRARRSRSARHVRHLPRRRPRRTYPAASCRSSPHQGWLAPDKVRRFVLREEMRTGGRGSTRWPSARADRLQRQA